MGNGIKMPKKGYKQTEEHTSKIVQSRKGYKHSEKTKRKMGLIHIGNTNRLGQKNTKKQNKLISESRLGNKNPSKKKEVREKISKTVKGLWKTKEFRNKLSKIRKELWKNKQFKEKQLKVMSKKWNVKPNKPEKIMLNIIQKNNLPFNYVGDGRLWIKSFNPDFICEEKKQIIEVFGKYWHNLPNIKERDKKRLQTYSKQGYDAFVIWDYELKENLKESSKKILKWVLGK